MTRPWPQDSAIIGHPMLQRDLSIATPAAGSSVKVIHDADELEQLRVQWALLRADAPAPTTCIDYLLAHSRSLPPRSHLFVVCVFTRGRLTAAAPFLRIRARSRPTRLRWFDTGDLTSALYRDAGTLGHLVEAIFDLRMPLVLTALSPGSATDRELRRRQPRGWVSAQRTWFAGPSIPLDGTWTEPLSKLGTKRRGELRRTMRKAEASGGVTFEATTPCGQPADWFDEFVAIESGGWKGRAGTSLAQDHRQRRDLHRYLSAPDVRPRVQVARMRVGGQTAAMHLNVVHESRMWGLKGAVNEAHRACSPGLHLFAYCIRRAAEEGLETYEFMGETDPIKEMWGAPAKELVRRRFYPPTSAGSMTLVADAASRGGQLLARAHRDRRGPGAVDEARDLRS